VRVLITGASGLVGSALARRLKDEDVIALSHRDLDITSDDSTGIVADIRPDIIFNCAVIGVDDCERDPTLAEAVNVDGPRALARAADVHDARMVHFSTNYVFDGERDPATPYAVADDARPISVYGRTKLAGEHAVTGACRRAVVVRTSWVFGSGKDSFLSTAARKLASGERVRAIVDTWASTTWVEDLVDRVLSIERPGTYHVANQGALTYELFAQECARLVGGDPSLIDRVTEAEMKRPAKRPRVTPMLCVPPLRPWQDALAQYVESSHLRND